MKTILLILIFISIDVYSQWTLITYPTLTPTKPYSVNGDSIYIFVDYIGWFSSFDNGESWYISQRFDDLDFIPDYPIFFDDNLMIISNYYGKYQQKGLYISTDYGNTFEICNWVNIPDGYNINDNTFLGQIFDIKKLNNEIFFGTETGLFYTNDFGKKTYIKDSPGTHLLYHSGITDESHIEMGLLPPLRGEVKSILLYEYEIFFVSNAIGSVFKNIKTPRNDTIESIYFPIMDNYFYDKYKVYKHPYFRLRANSIVELNGNIFVDFNGKLWKSQDKGDTWEEIESLGIFSIGKLYTCGNILYAIAYNNGILMSEDEGQTWQQLNLMKSKDFISEREITFCSNLQFTDNYAFLQTIYGICRAPLEDCKIVTDISSVESTLTEPKIFPNPASESITISGVGLGKLELYNTLGQKLIEKEITGTTQINTSTLQTGLYIIKLESAGEVVFEKVIVAR